jgi:hypothetical protein
MDSGDTAECSHTPIPAGMALAMAQSMFMLLLAFDSPTVLLQDNTHVPGAGAVAYTLFQATDPPATWPEDPGLGRWLHLESRHGEWLVPGFGAEDVVRDQPGIELFALGMTGFSAHRTLGFVDGDLVIVKESWSDRYSSTELDWELRYGRFDDWLEDSSSEGALLIARPWGYAPVEVPTWTVWGACDGEEDAGLRVSAQSRDEGVDLRLRILDDHEVAPSGPGDAALVSADHIELWLEGGRQLGIDLGDTPEARWLRGTGDRPSVAWDDDVLVVSLSADLLGEPVGMDVGELSGSYTDWSQPIGRMWPLTVVFSDSDGGRQQALVATSTLSWPGLGLGRLVVFDEGDRYPTPPGAVRR